MTASEVQRSTLVICANQIQPQPSLVQRGIRNTAQGRIVKQLHACTGCLLSEDVKIAYPHLGDSSGYKPSPMVIRLLMDAKFQRPPT